MLKGIHGNINVVSVDFVERDGLDAAIFKLDSNQTVQKAKCVERLSKLIK